ncbi:MAG: hypothetical protein QXK45_03885 [Thermofilaceae archaeon]
MGFFDLVDEFVHKWSARLSRSSNREALFLLAEQWLQLYTLAHELSVAVASGGLREVEADLKFAAELKWSDRFMEGALRGRPPQASWHDPGVWIEDAVALAGLLLYESEGTGLSRSERDHLFVLLSDALEIAEARGLNRTETTSLVSQVVLSFVASRKLTSWEIWGNLIVATGLAQARPQVRLRYPMARWEEKDAELAALAQEWLETRTEDLRSLQSMPTYDRSQAVLGLLRDVTDFLLEGVGPGEESFEPLSPQEAAQLVFTAFTQSPAFWKDFWAAIQPGFRGSSPGQIAAGVADSLLSVWFLISNFSAIGAGLGAIASGFGKISAAARLALRAEGGSGVKALVEALYRGTAMARRAGAIQDLVRGLGLFTAGALLPPVYWGIIALIRNPLEFKAPWDALLAMQTHYEWGPVVAQFVEKNAGLSKDQLLAKATTELFPVLSGQGLLASLKLSQLAQTLRVSPGFTLQEPILPKGSAELQVTEELAGWVLRSLLERYIQSQQPLLTAAVLKVNRESLFKTLYLPESGARALLDLAALRCLSNLAGQMIGEGKDREPWIGSHVPLSYVFAMPVELWEGPYTVGLAGVLEAVPRVWNELGPGAYVELPPLYPYPFLVPSVRTGWLPVPFQPRPESIREADVAWAIALGVFRVWQERGTDAGSALILAKIPQFANTMAQAYMRSGALKADFEQAMASSMGEVPVVFADSGVVLVRPYKVGSDAEVRLLFMDWFARTHGERYWELLQSYLGRAE